MIVFCREMIEMLASYPLFLHDVLFYQIYLHFARELPTPEIRQKCPNTTQLLFNSQQDLWIDQY